MRLKSATEVFRHRGKKALGIWSRPVDVKRRFPAVLFLHGFPGSEKNVDIQRELLARQVASFAFYFPGSWGSEGVYRFSNLVGDARAAWRHMRRLPGVDRRRTAVFGFSMGGWTALNVAALEPSCRAVAAVAPVGGPEMLQPGAKDRIGWLAKPLNTPSVDALYRDFARSVTQFDPAKAAARRRCPLLLVQGLKDEIVPPPVVDRIHARAAPPKTLWRRPDAYHDFLEQRGWLSRRVAGWLADRLQAPVVPKA